MILINVKFQPLPENVDNFRELVTDFTDATRAEDGCLVFDWYRSEENPAEYILVEGFEDDAAEAHVNSEHFARIQREFPQYLAATPQIVSHQVDGDGWGPMGELKVG